jgi:hypothetical protein
VLPQGEEERSFLCTAPAEGNYKIDWVANGTHLRTDGNEGTAFVVETLNDGKELNVTFRATEDVNNTNLSCVGTDFVTRSFIDLVNLTIIIQGSTSAPIVSYTMRDQSVQFSWSPPFSLDITDVDPDISHYLVTVINMEDGSEDSLTTTETELVLQSEECTLTEYQVEIAAVNVVGVGEKYISPPLSLEGREWTFALSDNASVVLGGRAPVLNFQVHSSCLREISLDIHLVAKFSNERIDINYPLGKRQTNLTISPSNLNEKYEANVTVDDLSSFLHTLYFSTFDVQDVLITPKSGRYDITCFFADGSKATGCRVVLIDRENRCELMATRQERTREAAVNVGLPAGEYSVLVYDIDDDERVGPENPAYTTTITSTSDTSDLLTPDCAFQNDLPKQGGNNILLVAILLPLLILFLLVATILIFIATSCITRRLCIGICLCRDYHV